MSEYTELIRKEKDEALLEFSEDTFQRSFDRKIAGKKQSSHSALSWFRRPAFAGSTVLVILFFGWLSSKIFLPSSPGSDVTDLKNTFAQLFSRHATILNQTPLPIDRGFEKPEIYEFEWAVKRVLYAIQRENAPDVDISESLNRVLQSTAALIKTGIKKNGEQNI